MSSREDGHLAARYPLRVRRGDGGGDGISRSQLYATAIREFVQAQKRNGITDSLNRVYEKVDQTPDPFLEALQRATLTRDPW